MVARVPEAIEASIDMQKHHNARQNISNPYENVFVHTYRHTHTHKPGRIGICDGKAGGDDEAGIRPLPAEDKLPPARSGAGHGVEVAQAFELGQELAL